MIDDEIECCSVCEELEYLWQTRKYRGKVACLSSEFLPTTKLLKFSSRIYFQYAYVNCKGNFFNAKLMKCVVDFFLQN